MLRHLNLKLCVDILKYNCIWFNELFLTQREMVQHLKNEHSTQEIEVELTKLLYKNCPKYIGPVPWKLKHFSKSQCDAILSLYYQWASSILRSPEDNDNLFTHINLPLCPNIELGDQLVLFFTKFLAKRKLSFKTNIWPYFILENIQTDELRMYGAYRNLSLFEKDEPKSIHNLLDVKKHFKDVTYDSIDKRIMYARPDTTFHALLTPALRIEITQLGLPIGYRTCNSRQNILNIPLSKKEYNMRIFKSLSYAIFCKKHKLNFPS